MGSNVNKRDHSVTAKPHVTRSKIRQTVEKSDNPDRRGGERVMQTQPCVYQLAKVVGYKVVNFSDGHALTLNASKEGFLLLMPRSPERKQVFEVHTALSTEERTVTLVEACWTRELQFGGAGKVYLVGVKSLFEPARFN